MSILSTAEDERITSRVRRIFGSQVVNVNKSPQILLFEDSATIREFQSKFPRFKYHLEDFSEANNAIQAVNLWTALHLEGFGCNLQHVNPTVDQRVTSEWNVPPAWSLKAQLVFGLPTGELSHEKVFKSTNERIMVPGMI